MQRRTFIKRSSSVVLSSVMGAYGARAYSRVNNRIANLLMGMENTDRVLVMVFLNGGNDGLNTLIPLEYLSQLNNARSNIVQPDNSIIELPGTGLGFHSAMSGLKELYDEDKLTIVQNVGYEDPNFSHFRSTDIWMSGSDADEIINSGWTGRYMNQEYPNYPFDYPNEEFPHPLAIEIGRTSSLLFQGPDTKMGLSIVDPSFFYDLLDNVEPPVPDGPAGERIELIRILQKQSEQYSLRVREAAESVNSQLNYPQHALAEQLKIVSRLIAGGLQTRLYLVQLGGFDTHANQVDNGSPTEGWHAYQLQDMSDSIKAFVRDTEYLGTQDRILGMVFSEFGRRIKSNNSNGSDHGAAGPLFMFGSTVEPGIIGSNPVIPDQVNVWDNLPYEFDYRQIYSSIFEDWFCVDRGEIEGTLLGDFENLNIVKESLRCDNLTSTKDIVANEKNNPLKVYPTATADTLTIEVKADHAQYILQVVTIDGRVLQTIPNGSWVEGTQVTQIDVSHLSAGNYYIRWADRYQVTSKPFIKM